MSKTCAPQTARLEALANFQVTQDRRDCWRHEAGLDGNGHGQLDYETGGAL